MDNNRNDNRTKIIIAGALIAAGTIARIIMRDLPNIEPITLAAILTGAFVGRKSMATLVPLSIVVLSDLVIGNTTIALFTWSAWGLIGLGTVVLRHFAKNTLFPFAASGVTLATSTFFFLWTNFGVWLESGMYARSPEGLLTCFTMALPFFRANLISNVIIVSFVTTGIILVQHGVIAARPLWGAKTTTRKMIE